MRLIKPSVEIWDQLPGEVGIYKQIERCGRVCYKSEDRLTEDSYKRFVEMLKSHAHGAMLEHGTVYLQIPYKGDIIRSKYYNNPYSRVRHHSTGYQEGLLDITTNYRVLVEQGWLDDLKYLCEPTEYHEKRITVHFSTDIGVSREFNRHRVNSMAEQSTRYCNYSKNKFGGELSICLPPEFTEKEVSKSMVCDAMVDYCGVPLQGLCRMIAEEQTDEFTEIDYWLFANLACEWSYMNLIRLGWTPQQARRVLPLDLNTELIHTAFVSDWEHFFELRCAKDAHPDARALAIPLREEFVKRGYIQ